MVQLAASFVLLLSLAATGLSAPVKRSVGQIKADISNVSDKLQLLNIAINNFPASQGTLEQALTIHTDAEVLDTAIKKVATDVKSNGALDLSDATSILSSVQAVQPSVHTALTGLTAKKVALDALPIGGVPTLVLSDLKSLDADTTFLASNLIANSPASLAVSATTLSNGIHNDFVAAITDYSSAS